jgi:hypothetical protein
MAKLVNGSLQLLLFPPSVNRPTSIAAAEEIQADAATLRVHVHAYIKAMGEHGCTDEEGITALEMNPSTYRPRRVELVQRGLIVDSGKVRKTVSGRNAVVWRVKP